ncbi:hypothetical protein FDA94_28825 [Herbidospora galbida]|uniref:Uncharacterized protein n=1 Tax=Herbidospora galbida TaxID=2575442 RepID=A0A4U3MAN5_9ACTN|nr:hypothetical protein [Herbidospora galbida]TKK84636.1 hypothetical protein FDA94_28825 [Herbidospora galbida]
MTEWINVRVVTDNSVDSTHSFELDVHQRLVVHRGGKLLFTIHGAMQQPIVPLRQDENAGEFRTMETLYLVNLVTAFALGLWREELQAAKAERPADVKPTLLAQDVVDNLELRLMEVAEKSQDIEEVRLASRILPLLAPKTRLYWPAVADALVTNLKEN